MDGVEDVGGLREKAVLDFVSRSNPIACTDYDRWSVEFIECQLSDLGGKSLECTPSFASVGGEHDLAGFLNRLDYFVVIERHDGSGIDHLAGDVVFFLQFVGLQRVLGRAWRQWKEL